MGKKAQCDQAPSSHTVDEGGVELVADRHLIKLCFLFLALISKLITKLSYNMSHNMEQNGQNRSRVETPHHVRLISVQKVSYRRILVFRCPTPDNSGFSFNWTSTNAMELNYLSITDSPTMEVGYRWQGHVFWNWYARSLDAVDVGNLQRIAQLDRDVGNWQFATAMLAFCSLFFFAILVGLACYCTRKESDDDDL
ncbi:hypothetical protein NECAME_14741 [Necator americanus]|uniref:Uncharacterized protein n=1 Tax=Necator americanus TaxID=51031 RepID=W2SLF9_NECAM|nr:hypothetical protein NECAME_14741 [Necator americanus]ETN70504.1 hypothetical protein NECAME_14741 [Necator americanus]